MHAGARTSRAQSNMMKSAAVPGETVNYYNYDGALMRTCKIDSTGATYYT